MIWYSTPCSNLSISSGDYNGTENYYLSHPIDMIRRIGYEEESSHLWSSLCSDSYFITAFVIDRYICISSLLSYFNRLVIFYHHVPGRRSRDLQEKSPLIVDHDAQASCRTAWMVAVEALCRVCYCSELNRQ